MKYSLEMIPMFTFVETLQKDGATSDFKRTVGYKVTGLPEGEIASETWQSRDQAHATMKLIRGAGNCRTVPR
jgi:hypothetical protein